MTSDPTPDTAVEEQTIVARENESPADGRADDGPLAGDARNIADALRASADLRAARERERAQQLVLEERLQALLASEQTAREEHRDERQRWSAELADVQHDLTEARETLATTRAEAQHERDMRAALEHRVSELEASERDLNGRFHEANERAANEAADALRSIAETREALVTAEAEAAADRRRREATEEQLGRSQEHVESTTAERDAARQELAAVRDELRSTAEDLGETRTELERRTATAGDLEATLSAAQSRSGELESELGDARGRIDELSDAFDRASRLEGELDEARAAAATTQEALAAARAEAEQQTGRADELDETLSEARAHIERLTAQLAGAEDRVAELTPVADRVAQLEPALADARERVTMLNERASLLEHDLEAAAVAEAGTREDLATAHAELERRTEELAAAGEAAKQLQTSLDGLQATLESERSARSDAEGRMEELRAEAETELARVRAEAEEQIAQAQSETRAQIDQVRAESTARETEMRSDADARIAALEAESARRESIVAATEERLNATFEARLAGILDRERQMQSVEREHTGRVDDARLQLTTLEQRIAEAQHTLSGIEEAARLERERHVTLLDRVRELVVSSSDVSDPLLEPASAEIEVQEEPPVVAEEPPPSVVEEPPPVVAQEPPPVVAQEPPPVVAEEPPLAAVPEPEPIAEPDGAADHGPRHRRRLFRRRRAGDVPAGCSVCSREAMALDADELRDDGWQVTRDVAVCPTCQAEGWEFPEGSPLPVRHSVAP